jgi:2-dehydro-3-deoxygalactonokinase
MTDSDDGVAEAARAASRARPALIGIDWGSSNLRAALLDAKGALIDRRESPDGVFGVADGDFGPALWRLCGDWAAAHALPLLACGMIGSRQGLVEVPYLACPARLADLAVRLACVELPQVPIAAGAPAPRLYIVPGLKYGSDASGWDVVRGEETQLLGLGAGPGSLTVLPGTHSKWMVQGPAGRIDGFQTYMTGELFELLRGHGSLSRVMGPSQWSPEAFGLGVDEARDGALEDLLFRVRTAGLTGRFPASALADYLSGLLIGAELKAGLRRFATRDPGRPIVVLGAAALTRRYATAMASFGLTATEVAGDAVFDGLVSIARAAGLLHPASPLPEGESEARP